MGLSENCLLTNAQVHGNEVVVADGPDDGGSRPQADALVTRRPGLGLGILTADCAPVLFADGYAGVIGAAHAGWKGALGGVLEATVDNMLAQGGCISRIIAVVGPSIQQASYQVDGDFRRRFLQVNDSYARFFRPDDATERYRFDLSRFVTTRLRDYGVRRVMALARDTYAEPDCFFSYRRSSHGLESDYGRQVSVIALI